jgi:hypothetical protein
MSLLNLHRNGGRRSRRHHSPAFRPSLDPTLDALEQRTVLSGPGTAMLAPAVLQSPINITGVHVTNLAVTGANTLTATLNVAGNLITKAGTTPFNLPNIQVPITFTPTGQTADGCPILNLSLQIPDLNLLGLHVRLDNCNNGPVNVNITAIPSTETGGGLLGDLLCSVDNLLNGTGGLLNLGGQTSAVTGALTRVLNGILTDLVTGTNAGTGGTIGSSTSSTDTIPAGDTELVDLHLGPISADILGLQITTSQICLNVYADPNGGLLGELLTSLDNLLNNNGSDALAAQVLVGNNLKDLRSLGA